MRSLQWLGLVSLVLLVGCAPKANDGITPTQPSYTNGGFPNPLVIFNGTFLSGCSPNVYEYSPNGQVNNAAASVLFPDTSTLPQAGNANLINVVQAYNNTTWVGFPVLTTGSVNLTSGNYSSISFYVKGAFTAPVSTGVVGFNGLGEPTIIPVTVTTNWQAVTLTMTAPVTGVASTELFCSNFYPVSVSAPVTTYYDQIQFQ
jgi:hypothetical protein